MKINTCTFRLNELGKVFFRVNIPHQIQIVLNGFFFLIIADEDTGDYSRLQGWWDVREGDIKIFLAHLIAMLGMQRLFGEVLGPW